MTRNRRTKRSAFPWSLPPRLLKASVLFALALAFMILLVRGCVLSRQSGEGSPALPPLVVSYGEPLPIYNDETERIEHMPLEEYLIGVVAAEMPASFEPEALKAQAVAARTFTLRRMGGYGGSSCSQPGAIICMDSTCCQAYRGESALRKNWGANADLYLERVQSAVLETAGMVAVYHGAPIEALYHSTAGGVTENAENVFASAQPYLVSVLSPGEEDAAHYTDQIKFSRKRFTERLNAAFKRAKLSQNKLGDQVEVLSRFESGRVETVKIGSVKVTGREFRKALDLPSANFTLRIRSDEVIINTLGYGHGVGMSQYGANAMAKEGSSYQEILMHYYQGIDVVNMETIAGR